MELLFNVIGHPGAGKSEVCKHLERQWGFEVYSPSRLIRDFANKNGLKLRGREEFSRCHKLMIEDDPLALVKPILGSEALRLCVDGLRSPLDTQRLKEYGGYVISLVASREVRYRRVVQDNTRDEARLPISFDDFCLSETADIHDDPRLTNTQAIIDAADLAINTEDSSAAEVTHELDAIVLELLENPKDHNAILHR
jgi:dephospho-CoA kinase